MLFGDKTNELTVAILIQLGTEAFMPGFLLLDRVRAQGYKAALWQWYTLLWRLRDRGYIESQENRDPEVMRRRGGRPEFQYRLTPDGALKRKELTGGG